MPGDRRASYLGAFLALASVACNAEEPPAASPGRLSGVSDDSLICKAVTDRFVGIPGLDEGGTARQVKALAGRWWVRGCSAKHAASGVRVHLEGPGWYFVDQRDGDFALRQQVGFTLAIELEGTPELTMANGVASLWLEPKTTPRVEVRVDHALNVHATSVWGSLVGLVPLVSVRDRAAERLSTLAVSALQSELREGATATYDLESGQRDVALGKLPAGQTPHPAFPGAVPWLINDRLFLPPSATQVVGPIDPGPTRLDLRIEQGAGLAYRTVCQADMPAGYDAIASAHLEQLAPRASDVSGTLAGSGEQSALFRVDGCRFFVVLSTLGDSTTVAALRVRG